MTPSASAEMADRVVERRRAVALANHYREVEGLSIAQIAERLGRWPATVKTYFYDPTGEKARAVKARHQGVCRGCGAHTQPRNGKGDAYRAIEARWTTERVLDAMCDWRARYGRLPTSYDWSRTRVGAGERRSRASPMESGRRRASSHACSVRGAALARWSRRWLGRCSRGSQRRGPPSFARNSISLPKPRESTAISEDLIGGEEELQQADLQDFCVCGADSAHNSGR
jgi:hypothetical protein